MILYQLAKFQYQTFTSQYIKLYVFLNSCVAYWWRHKQWLTVKEKGRYKNLNILRTKIYAHSLHPPPHLPLLGDGGLSHFSEWLYRRALGQIWISDGPRTLGGGGFFEVGHEMKTPCTKNLEYESQTNKETNDSDFNFYNFS